MHKTGKIEVVSPPQADVPSALAGAGSDIAWFLRRAEELREQYMNEMAERCEGSEYPDYEARMLVAGWFADLRAEYETRLQRLEALVTSLVRQGRRG
jgi:hypothetical protein